MLYGNKQMHYHLSGSLIEYRNLAPSNLLLYKAALWGCEQGFKTFHLGGGVGSGEDGLYKFKAAFNRNSNYQFSIGKEDKVLRKIFLDMLADSGFVSWLLDYYSMGIDTFVKVIFRNYGDIFNSAIFLKKVRKIVSEKKYKRSIDF